MSSLGSSVCPETMSGCSGSVRSLTRSVLLLLVLACGGAVAAGWQNNLPPRRYVRLDPRTTASFHGNHSDGDVFRVVYRDESSIIIGARGVAYNVSLANMQQISKLNWLASDSDAELCRLKGKPEVQCHNYIRVFVRTADGTVMVCGTNAFKPRCRSYSVTGRDGGYLSTGDRELSGAGLCPFSPLHNSTSVYVGGGLYVGTVADFSGQDALIRRDNIRTEKWDTGALNDPHFVSSFSMDDHVYMLFRETAIEYINCGKRVYSRVGRVCRRDVGGQGRYKRSWTSYVKTRLNCSAPGDFPFYFDEIQASTDVVSASYSGANSRLVYAVFTTEPNAIGGSAVCAFSVAAIGDAFAGAFKQRASLNSNWLPLASDKVPEPRPGQCVNDSRALPDMMLNFIKRHPLMDEPVMSLFNAPLLTRVSTSYRFSAITVDARVRTAGVGENNGQRYVDVLFIGTDNGRVIKMFNSHEDKIQPVVIEEIQVFNTGDAVRSLHISRMGEPKLVASSDNQLLMLPLHRCYTNKIAACSECVALQDPYCAWDLRRRRCMYIGNQRYTGPDYVQNVQLAVSHRCPEGVVKSERVGKHLRRPSAHEPGGAANGGDLSLVAFHSDSTGDHRHHSVNVLSEPGHSGPSLSSSHHYYSAETLAVSVLCAALAALIVGFVAGHCCARRVCRKEDVNLPYADTDYTYFDQRHNANNRLAHEQNLLSEEVTYSEPVLIPTNSMLSTLKKQQQAIPLQLTDKYDGAVVGGGGNAGVTSLRADKSATHRPLRAHRPLLRDDSGVSDEMYRRECSLRREVGAAPPPPAPAAPPAGGSDGYSTTRSVRRVYL